jgi:hypothetical protein
MIVWMTALLESTRQPAPLIPKMSHAVLRVQERIERLLHIELKLSCFRSQRRLPDPPLID